MPVMVLNSGHRQSIRKISAWGWVELAILGVVFYTFTQGAQFISLSFLPSATLSLLLNFSPILIAFYSMLNQSESTSLVQWGGILLTIAGVLVYFLPLAIEARQIPGLVAGVIAVLANSASSIFGRNVNSRGRLSPLVVTTDSMGVGGILMLGIGILTQGMSTLTLT